MKITYPNNTDTDFAISGWAGYENALKSDPEGVKAVLRVASRIPHTKGREGIEPSLMHELAHIIQRESAWNPHIVNSIGCVGLIQFCDPKGEGSTLEKMRAMSLSEQAPYVERYFQRILKSTGPASRPGDLYMATFYPAAFHTDDGHVIGESTSTGFPLKVWEQNPGLRCSPQGPITSGCVRAYGTPHSDPPSGFPDIGSTLAKSGKRGPGWIFPFTLLAMTGIVAASRKK